MSTGGRIPARQIDPESLPNGNYLFSVVAGKASLVTFSPYTDEQAQDTAAALFTTGTHGGISFAYDDVGNKINATVSGATYTDEQARDAVATALVPGNGVDIVTDDPGNTITISVEKPIWVGTTAPDPAVYPVWIQTP